MFSREIGECLGGCGRRGEMRPDHPALMGYLCEECRRRILGEGEERIDG